MIHTAAATLLSLNTDQLTAEQHAIREAWCRESYAVAQPFIYGHAAADLTTSRHHRGTLADRWAR